MIKIGPWVLLRKWELEERDQEMWSDGYHTDEDAVQDQLGSKDDLIERQADLVRALMHGEENGVEYINWARLPDHLRDQMPDYL